MKDRSKEIARRVNEAAFQRARVASERVCRSRAGSISVGPATATALAKRIFARSRFE
jgi:hypothetical protein